VPRRSSPGDQDHASGRASQHGNERPPGVEAPDGVSRARTRRAGRAATQSHAEELAFAVQDRAYAAHVIEVMAPVIPALAEALRPRTEVVLHDLTKMPNSIAAIGGAITGRNVEGPTTDLGLRVYRSDWREHMIGYRTETSDGMVMRSSTIFFHAPSGKPVACLCINTDIHSLVQAHDVLAALTFTSPTISNEPPLEANKETFPASVEALTERILRDAIAAVGVPVQLMKKAQKMTVVRELDTKGFFALREAAELAANRLRVSRYTIYNYLNELQAAGSQSDAPGPTRGAFGNG
jgi:predicted transcriptional regulator YheO